jgi:hypothetical protein
MDGGACSYGGGLILDKKYVVLWSLVGHKARKGEVVFADVLGGEDSVKVHLARGAIREATEAEVADGKATLDESGKDARTLEEQLRAERKRADELAAKNVELLQENLKLSKSVVEVVKHDPALVAKVAEQEKVIRDLMHRLQQPQPVLPDTIPPAEDKKKK